MADAKTVEAGKKAPAVSLPDQSGKLVNSSDFAGQWVVL